jgi:thioredoxin 1
MSRRRVFLTALALAACAGCGSEPTSPTGGSSADASAVVTLTSASFSGQVLAEGTLWMVEFYSPGCPYCQAMTATVESLAVDFHGRASVGKVNVDVEAPLAQTYQVAAVPTFIVFRNGREISRYVGATSYEILAELLRSAQAAL